MELKTIVILAFLASIASTTTLVIADSIQGCGGFVEASSYLIKSRKSSDSKLDYSNITVELRTVDGLVKDSTQCAPNGYYFIPVYDKGSFVIKIKGPEGWSWDPEKVPVVIDQNGCNANTDINFRFTGFTLSGKVNGAVGGDSCNVKDEGPSNVKIELLSHTDDLVSSTSTTAAGSYLLTNIIPGKYKLRASHSDLKVEVRGSSEVELGFGNGVVDDIFYVPGYNIEGFVVAQGNPILGVHIYLYSDDVHKVDCPQGSGNSPTQKSSLCHAISDADGKFIFNSIPCGVYELLPYYKGENTVFDVSPPSMLVSVEHRHVAVTQKFQVTGFSVGGRVIDGYGVGVDGVVIIVDGQERATTDAQGHYKLDQVTSKRYKIVAKKEHYQFDNLENFLVLPNMASVADIKAIYYDICGVVRMVNSGQRAKVALTGPENFKPDSKSTDEAGRFCFQVPAGEYHLVAIAAGGSSELLFLPAQLDVTVKSPLLNVEFSQAQVDIRGTVLCKEKCGPSTLVSLRRSSGTHKEKSQQVILTQESNEFAFSKVSPGKYKLEVKHKSSPDSNEDKWCWEQSSIDVEVRTEDINGIAFVQKGYWIDITSTHDVDGFINQPDTSVLKTKIKTGAQRICVESPGVHELHFVNSCISFGSSFVKFDTSNPMPIVLNGEKYLLRGQIHVDSSLRHIEDELSKNIVVDILNSDGEVFDASLASLVSDGNAQTSTAVYEYSVWANLGDVLTFVPRDSRNTDGKKILFYPKERYVSVTTNRCQDAIPSFSGRLGLYIEGSVSPTIPGVDIRVIAAGESSNVPLKKGGLAMKTTTGSDGLFVAGPLYDDIDYAVEASKSGYHLKRVGPTSFSCQKLSQISVRIHSEEDASNLFPPVLLSLSGEDGYRNNSASALGGFYLFENLFPGSFYLRPLLKEYSFSPPAQAIELGSGESKEVVFQATRVAYSAMGTVSLLSGQPMEGISVEARSESKGYYEETTTDSSGNFRLRGLLPDTSYSVKVAAKEDFRSARVERASPEFVEVKVGTEDTKGLDFVVFEQPEVTILTGHVEGDDLEELQSHLFVEVKSASDPSKISKVLQLPLSNFFQIRDLPRAKHLLQLQYSARSSILKFESSPIEVDLEKQSHFHIGPIRYTVKEDYQKQELTSAPLLPLIAGLSAVALVISMPRLKDLYQSSIASSGSSIKKEMRKPIIKKRTY
ncbi:hypothetical protein MKW92_014647 [Papaver armeniacum]|nr:hypothetical protein MKW92_014647 [Papaver armeniacum]